MRLRKNRVLPVALGLAVSVVPLTAGWAQAPATADQPVATVTIVGDTDANKALAWL